MKQVRLHKLAICMVIVLLTFKLSLGINFGSLQKQKIIKIDSLKTVQTPILVWTSEKQAMPITFETLKKPEGFSVVIFPSRFYLSQSLPNVAQVLILPNGREVKTFVVNVFIKPTHLPKPGNYTLTIAAKIGKKDKGISVLQERKFNFVILVEGNTSKPLTTNLVSAQQQAKRIIEEPLKDKLSLVAATLVVLLLSWVFYKL